MKYDMQKYFTVSKHLKIITEDEFFCEIVLGLAKEYIQITYIYRNNN